jgi:hypothetical protein
MPTVVLSLVKPHKIISISTQMCDFFGFEEAEIVGRSFNLLQGPKTDVQAVTGAIKNTGVLISAQFATSLYARNGSELYTNASCVPYFAGGGVLAGCKLQLLPEGPGLMDSTSRSDEAVAERLVQAERAQRACYRSKYNLITGLTIQRAMLLHHATTRPAPEETIGVCSEPGA